MEYLRYHGFFKRIEGERFNQYRYTTSQDGTGRVKYHFKISDSEAQILDFHYKYEVDTRWCLSRKYVVHSGNGIKNRARFRLVTTKTRAGKLQSNSPRTTGSRNYQQTWVSKRLAKYKEKRYKTPPRYL